MKKNSVLKLHGELVCAPSIVGWLVLRAAIPNATFIFTWVIVIGTSLNIMKNAVGSRLPNDSGCKQNITFG